MRALLMSALLVAGMAAAEQPRLPATNANYSVAWGGTTLGEATIRLTPLEHDCYRYEQQTHPIALVRWIYGSPLETSQFCMQDGAIRVSHFEFRNDKRDQDNFTVDFDWTAKKVTGSKRGVVTVHELDGPAWDRFALQQVVRLWARAHADAAAGASVEFNMADDNRVTAYRFAIVGREHVATPAGGFDTLRVDRVDNPNRQLRSWLAPSLDYAPVKIENVEKGDVKLRMLLK